MVNNSSKLNLYFDTRIITFPSKEKGEFDQSKSLVLSLPVTYNRYLTKLSVVKSIHFPFGVCCFQFLVIFLTIICFDWDEFGRFWLDSGGFRSFLAGFGWVRIVSSSFMFYQLPSPKLTYHKRAN